MKNACALVLGGYINGYSIIRELSMCGVSNIWLFDCEKSLASRSNKISGFKLIDNSTSSLFYNIELLHKNFDQIVIYPTNDLHLELLFSIKNKISNYCYLPFNESNLLQSLDKFIQYTFCEKLNIPYPKTVKLEKDEDFQKLEELVFPILIKPNTRKDLTTNVFRSLFVNTNDSLEEHVKELKEYLKQGVSLLASEYIPGDDSNIYAYTAFRSKEGEILNEWIGKKLSQFPDSFGVFSSSSNEAPEIVREQGRLLLNTMNLTGIAQPEFKYDLRDKRYKLMEINLRSMMWHRLGNLCGVNLHYTQWRYALGLPIEKEVQCVKSKIHFIYMKHEIINLLFRKKYWRYFKYNIFKGDKRFFAVYDREDIKPFLFDLLILFKIIISRCLKVLRTQ